MSEFNKSIIPKILDVKQNVFTQVEHGKRLSIVYNYDAPIDINTVEIKPTQVFSLFNMHSISTLGIIFGYLFTVESKWVKVFDTYFFVKRQSSREYEHFTGTELIYQSKYINIYNSQDGCSLITGNNLYDILDRDMIRRRKVKDEV